MSNDILDVLNIQSNGEPSAKRQKTAAASTNADSDVKLTGITRELYQLLGQNTPPILLKQQSKFKDKTLGKVTPWHWSKFNNNAREDGLQLSHWVKGSAEVSESYKFEKYSTKGAEFPTFTKEDYEAFLDNDGDEEEDDQEWDYEETHYLFELARIYDLNWIVIHDRYKYEGRQVEDLKERFYDVCQRILIHQNEASATNMNSNLISNLNYNKTKELERKEYLERLLARTPAEIAEEESLLIEAKKYEISAKKTITERSQLLQLLDSPMSNNSSIQQYLTSQGLTQLYNTLMTTKTKRKQNDNFPENPLAVLNEKLKSAPPAQVQPQQTTTNTRKQNPLTTLLSKNLTLKEEQQYGIQTHTEKLTPGVYLRSSKIPQFKATAQTKINSVLAELGVGVKPTMPTALVMNRYEELIKSVNLVLELKKQVDKLDAGR